MTETTDETPDNTDGDGEVDVTPDDTPDDAGDDGTDDGTDDDSATVTVRCVVTSPYGRPGDVVTVPLTPNVEFYLTTGVLKAV